ncbi:MAG: FAD-dependent oxidoreductase [Flavobacteriaceae bacterium]|nr:FAD-dependent oxidoreductase [Flavobacteriaceae bacterium]
MSKNIIIIGGGIIGLCSAYYLHKEGHQITIVDQSNLDSGASYINAGYLSPSHLIPLSAPGVMKKGIKWMLNPASPLYIKPRLEPDFLKWVWAFNKSCNAAHVSKAIPVIKSIALLSQNLMEEIKTTENFKFHYVKKGLLMLCQTEKMLEEEIKLIDLARQSGLDAEVLSMTELKKLEPNVKIEAIGATYFKCDQHTTPLEFMEEMKKYLLSMGVEIIRNEEVTDLTLTKGKITSIQTSKQSLKADEFVLAAGAWSGLISKKLGFEILMQAGKGYAINRKKPTGITLPAILAEAKVAITPMNGFTRFAGTMEITEINDNLNRTRVEAIARAAKRYYPEIELSSEEKEHASFGLRPLSFDGLPYIGKSDRCKNLTVASGHAMMGWSMATATGKLVSEIISDKKTSLNIAPFAVDRKN